jgi:small conductance mechanosensitive channel
MYSAGTIANIFNNHFVRAATVLVVIIIVQLIVNKILNFVIPILVTDKHHKNKKDELKREATLKSVFKTLAGFIIWVIGILLILGQLHVNIAALATGAGLIGIVIGFGAQKLIQDFLAGMFIVMEHQYRIGDYITLNAGGNISGTVEDFTIRITKLRDMDGNLNIVSNGAAITAINYTTGFGNINLDIRVSYDADIDEVEKIVNEECEALGKSDKWQDEIIDPITFLRVNSLDESAVNFKIFGKVKTGQQWSMGSDLQRRLKKAFEKHDIKIPYQQIVIHEPSSAKNKTK